MRLNGRKAVLTFFGFSQGNHRAWARIRSRYAMLLYVDEDTNKVWADSEELLAAAKRRSECLSSRANVVQGGANETHPSEQG